MMPHSSWLTAWVLDSYLEGVQMEKHFNVQGMPNDLGQTRPKAMGSRRS